MVARPLYLGQRIDALEDRPLASDVGTSETDVSEGDATSCPSTGPLTTASLQDWGDTSENDSGAVSFEDGAAIMCDDGLFFLHSYLDDAVLSGTVNDLGLHFHLVATRHRGLAPDPPEAAGIIRRHLFWASTSDYDDAEMEEVD